MAIYSRDDNAEFTDEKTSTSEYNGSARPFRWICVNTKRSTVANHDDVPKHSSISGIPHIPS